MTSEGNVFRSAGIAQDISRIKQAEMALRSSEEQYRELIENIHEIVFILDTRGKIHYISIAVEKIFGL